MPTFLSDIEAFSEDERKAVIRAVRSSIDLRARYTKLFTEDKKMRLKQKRFRDKELPVLRSALKKLTNTNK